jgi:hypothetical protein
MEDIIFRRRNRLKKHFVNTSNVVLCGYRTLSDGARVTFQVIDGFDWEDKETEDSKGYVFPAIETIAERRGATERTIFRHVKELEQVKLLTRVRRRNKPSIFYIEDVSEEEADLYLARFVDRGQPTKHHQGAEVPAPSKKTVVSAQSRTDKNVVSHKAPETTKMSFAYNDEKKEKKENEIHVNEFFNRSDGEKRSGMQGVGEILKRFDSVSKKAVPKRRIVRTSQHVPARKQGGKGTRASTKPEEIAKRDYVATQIATELQDENSLGCYRVIAEKVPEHALFEILASVKDTWKEGKVKKSRGALFVDLIKTYCKANQLVLPFAEKTVQGSLV